MFRPVEHVLERGWVGRVDGERVIHLAAQTLQSFFLGGGAAREHAEYPLGEVRLLVPVQYPPTVRIFRAVDDFAFANASAVVGTEVAVPRPGVQLAVVARLAAVIGAEEGVGGYTLFLEWNGSRFGSAKLNDYGVALGPVVVTPDGVDVGAISYALRHRDSGGTERGSSVGTAEPFDWPAALRFAAFGTKLRPGDVVAGPEVGMLEAITDGSVALEADPFGTLTSPLGDPI